MMVSSDSHSRLDKLCAIEMLCISALNEELLFFDIFIHVKMWCFMLYNGSESCFYGSKSVNNNNMQPAVISVKIPEKNSKFPSVWK